jgi:tRNA A22 N-methylase
MNREEAVAKYLKKGEQSSNASNPADLPENIPDTLIFTGSDCTEIVSFLKNKKDSSPVKRLVVQSCLNHPYLRGWLKANGYIIYGEELWKEDEFFCETTAAVLESMADENEIAESDKALRAEAHFYGTEEMYNEISLLLRVYNNLTLPELLYAKIAEAGAIAIEIDKMESAQLTDELDAKKHRAISKIQQLGIMGNTMYPID